MSAFCANTIRRSSPRLLHKLHVDNYRKISTTFTKFHSIHKPLSKPQLSHTFHHRYFSQNEQEKTNENEEENDTETPTDPNEELQEFASDDESDNDQNEQIMEMETKIQSLETELKKYKDALARSQADIINLTNMSKKDVESAKKFATKSFSKDILNVADSLQNCIKVVEEHLSDYKDEENHKLNQNIKSVIEGVKITNSTLMDTFNRHGIKQINSLNEEFDPNIHEALFKTPTDECPPNRVVQVIAEGYTIQGAVLRAAKVGISTNPPVQQNEDENDEK